MTGLHCCHTPHRYINGATYPKPDPSLPPVTVGVAETHSSAAVCQPRPGATSPLVGCTRGPRLPAREDKPGGSRGRCAHLYASRRLSARHVRHRFYECIHTRCRCAEGNTADNSHKKDNGTSRGLRPPDSTTQRTSAAPQLDVMA